MGYESSQPQKSPEKESFVDPAADGWQKTSEGYWFRRTSTGEEYLGRVAVRGTLSPEQMLSYYDREKELERRLQAGNKDAAKELESIRQSIKYLERYGPAVMGGE